MKISTVTAAALLVMAPAASAWRIRLYNWEERNPAGGEFTKAGPGNPGSACHDIPDSMDRKASSMAYYATDSQSSPTTRCRLNLYDGLNCGGSAMYGIDYDVQMNLAPVSGNWGNRARSFKTTCWRI
ncbi:uncharacterized protein DNG_06158 [Cephalotrichum gorgonifer]|uniref:Uncharacterized protein n=1 Tax=Cephalotrichum gorgonifer TaxID=2041049 RepID=A0AAE8N258_9PEZI|nr:uncharacterized protein DNG_06158 [Cephalotrichum gorgonifer]